MRLDHPGLATASQYVDVGFLRRRYRVSHMAIRRWVDDYIGEECGEHGERERGCKACTNFAIPPVPLPDAVRNGTAALWRRDRVGEWDDWVRAHIARMSANARKRLKIRVPRSGKR